MRYTKLHHETCEDERLAALADEDPELIVIWHYLLAGAAPWGRFPAAPRLLKARLCPLVDRLDADKLGRPVDRLIEAGMLTRCSCPWRGDECLAVTHFSRWNGAGRQYHRMGKPEFGPSPAWEPPADLLRYLAMVAKGRFRGKTVAGEAEKFGVPPDRLAAGGSLGPLPRDHSGKEKENEHTTPTPRRARSGSARREPGSAAFDPGSRIELEALWASINGPVPRRQSEKDCYLSARSAWLDGKAAPTHGYRFPPLPKPGPRAVDDGQPTSSLGGHGTHAT